MKRAEVFKAHVNGVPCWHIDVWGHRGQSEICTEHVTHAEALAHALAGVGLDKPVEHREAP